MLATTQPTQSPEQSASTNQHDTIEWAALRSHEAPPPKETIDPTLMSNYVTRLSELKDSMLSLCRTLDPALVKQARKEVVAADNSLLPIKSKLTQEEMSELQSATQLLGINIPKNVERLEHRFTNQPVTVLDLGGSQGKLIQALEKAFPNLHGFVMEKYHLQDILAKPESDRLASCRYFQGCLYQLSENVPQNSFHWIISRNTIGVFAPYSTDLVPGLAHALIPGGRAHIDIGGATSASEKKELIAKVLPPEATGNPIAGYTFKDLKISFPTFQLVYVSMLVEKLLEPK
jgi:hypothetical protein